MTSLSATGLDALLQRVQQELDHDHLSAAQLAIAVDGQVIEFHSFGTATPDSRFVVFSATKALTAMALLPHLADGSLDLTRQVAHYIPEFGENGKGEVTVLQLLTMQGGFPQEIMSHIHWGTSAGRRAAFAEWKLAWPAGSRTEYHPSTAHWVIAELLETLNGRSYVDVVHDRVVAPAGVGPLLGPAAMASPPVTVRVAGTRPAHAADLVEVYGRPDLVPDITIGPEALLRMNDPRVQSAAVPGGGGIASAADMARVYQGFLPGRNPHLPAAWVADAIGTVRNGSVNASDGVPANRTVAGYISGSDGYHHHRWMPAASRAFGHPGAGGQLCWIDPESGISWSFLHDTLHQDPRVEFRRAEHLHQLLFAALRP